MSFVDQRSAPEPPARVTGPSAQAASGTAVPAVPAPRRTRPLWQRLVRDRATLIALLLLVVVFLSALAPELLATHEPNTMHITDRLAAPSISYVLGTDEFGRDIWSRIAFGSRVAMFVAVTSMVLAAVVGVPLGLVSGWYGGLMDSALMRLQDAILAFPSLLFAILVVALLGPSAWTVVMTMWIVYVPRFARLVRGNVLLLKDMEFVVAERALGAHDWRIMLRHLLPNVFPTVLVQISLGMAFAILVEAALSYLGLGVQPPEATWGSMLRVAQRYGHEAPWYVLAPGGAIFVVVLLLNFVGDRLRDHLDPRLRRAGE